MEITYTKHGDYYLPDLDIQAQEKVPVTRYGRLHGDGPVKIYAQNCLQAPVE